MDDKKYPLLISERECRDWVTGCPVQVKKIRIEQPSENTHRQIFLTTAKCGGFSVSSVSVTLEFLNSRREVIGKAEMIPVSFGESQPIECTYDAVQYANAVVEEVVYDGSTWTNENASRPVKLPDQDLFWTTDPLYEQIRCECDGVVEAKYKPDRIDGAWRCACGQVNLASSETCGACGCSLTWLDEHLNRAYLEEQKKISDAKSEKERVREKKKKSREPSDKVKAVLILAGIAALILLVVLLFTAIIPSIRYASAVSLAEKGEYDKSAAVFTALGDFRDAGEQASAVIYKKAQEMTGLEKVYMTTSAAEPWFKIDETGMLSFLNDKYDKSGKSWQHVVVPDIVDGIMVTSLEKNCFLNCKEMTVVTISDCVTEIGDQAFLNCEMLHTINFGKNTSVIGSRAFIDCHALEEITIPDTVTSLGARAFNNCYALKKVILGTGITQIPDYQFSQCSSLTSVTLSSPITRVGDYAFFECGALKNIFCRFPQSDWTEPEIGAENAAFQSAKISFDN